METEKHYRFGSLRWTPRPVLELEQRRIPVLTASPIVDAALTAPHVQGARIWMRFPYAEVDSGANGHTVYLLDARYARSRRRGFGAAVVELGPDLSVRPEH